MENNELPLSKTANRMVTATLVGGLVSEYGSVMHVDLKVEVTGSVAASV